MWTHIQLLCKFWGQTKIQISFSNMEHDQKFDACTNFIQRIFRQNFNIEASDFLNFVTKSKQRTIFHDLNMIGQTKTHTLLLRTSINMTWIQWR